MQGDSFPVVQIGGDGGDFNYSDDEDGDDNDNYGGTQNNNYDDDSDDGSDNDSDDEDQRRTGKFKHSSNKFQPNKKYKPEHHDNIEDQEELALRILESKM